MREATESLLECTRVAQSLDLVCVARSPVDSQLDGCYYSTVKGPGGSVVLTGIRELKTHALDALRVDRLAACETLE